MKTILTTTIAAQSTASLLNLRNHHLLSNNKITALETIAFIETFDEVPIFGGAELRERMLSQANNIKRKVFGLDT